MIVHELKRQPVMINDSASFQRRPTSASSWLGRGKAEAGEKRLDLLFACPTLCITAGNSSFSKGQNRGHDQVKSLDGP
jgi:hypothetical protein